MGDHQKRGRTRLALLEQEVERLLLGGGVEVAGRLIGKDQTGFRDERAGYRDALPLALRELTRAPVEQSGEAQVRSESTGA